MGKHQSGVVDYAAMNDADRQRFERLKRHSVAQLLMRCARLVNERGIALARERFQMPNLRASHMALLPHIPFEGTRQTALAEALGVTKQAVGQLVDDLVAAGVLERVPDPSDRRAKIVRFGARGGEALFEGMAVLAEVEQPLVAALGDRSMDELGRLLRAVDDALSQDG